MSFDPGAIEAALATALGDDAALIAELRQAFRLGAKRAMGAYDAAPDAGGRAAAARRLRGLAASFGATELMKLAERLERGSADPLLRRRLARAIHAL